ncbi:MAG: class I SAM-dependent methyltransferase [Rhodocyclaceae bacterium]|nr:class I SAM-dependent methyltransferase [Rhodocyclaceae bacterium]
MTPATACPCCGSSRSDSANAPEPHHHCMACGHRWRQRPKHIDYRSQRGRNALAAETLERKYCDRLASLQPQLADGQRLIEIGCAEGELGRRIKSRYRVDYTGIEPSNDARLAGKHLDHVRPDCAGLAGSAFDGILAFHVLEHIDDISAELGNWHCLCADSGWIVVEVPRAAGHPDLHWDRNTEHLHQFSGASLATLVEGAGFRIDRLDAGHFESVGYPDCLRLLARPARSPEKQQADLLARFHRHLSAPFLVRGCGGDFSNYVAPLADRLPIAGFVGPAQEEPLPGIRCRPYRPADDTSKPILIGTLRFEREVIEDLLAEGHPAGLIVTLSRILER